MVMLLLIFNEKFPITIESYVIGLSLTFQLQRRTVQTRKEVERPKDFNH